MVSSMRGRGLWPTLILSGVAGGFGTWLASPPPIAQAATPPQASGDTIALTSEGVGGAQWLYLIDTSRKTVCIYEFDGKKSLKMKLAAVRHYATDQDLLEYNNDSPHVADIEKLVHKR